MISGGRERRGEVVLIVRLREGGSGGEEEEVLLYGVVCFSSLFIAKAVMVTRLPAVLSHLRFNIY